MAAMTVRLLLAGLAVAGLAGCGSPPAPTATPAASASPTPDLASRPSSPVQVSIVSPTQGEVVHGQTVHVVVSISGGQISQVTTTQVFPTLGHIHLYLNGQLIYMAYTLTQDVPVQPGQSYSLSAEFVAGDHFPFNPRDQTQPVSFSVAQ